MLKILENGINKGFSPIARGLLAVFACLFGVGMILMSLSSEKSIAVFSFGSFCILISVICITHGRLRQFFGSIIGVCLFGLAVGYAYSQIMTGPIDSGHRSEPSVLNSILFLLAFGIPGISYAMRAKFGYRNKSDNKNRHWFS